MSFPRSHVRDRRICAGSTRIAWMRAFLTSSVSRPLRKLTQHDESRLSIDACATRGVRLFAQEHIAFPVAWNRAVLDLRRAIADQHHVFELACAHSAAQGATLRTTRAEAAREFLAERATPLHEERLVDRLMRHALLQVVGESRTPTARRSVAATTGV